MIRVEKPVAPAILTTKGKQAAQAHCDAFDGGARFQINPRIYAAKAVKDALIAAQHGKCAFCESKFRHLGYGDVEHFRPKAAYRQRDGGPLERPGYFWLAYEWSNLFASCQICNQQFKKNLFPLRLATRRAKSHRHRLSDEDPLLIDCGAEDPEIFIGFRGAVAVAVRRSRRGRATIEAFGLNRSELFEQRTDRLAKVRSLERNVQLLEDLIARIGVSPDPELDEYRVDLGDYRAKLAAMTLDESAYASMARYALGAGRTRGRKVER